MVFIYREAMNQIQTIPQIHVMRQNNVSSITIEYLI